MENKQTAIMAISKPLSELVEKLTKYGFRNQDEFLDEWERIFVEHNEIFKEQIMKAYKDGNPYEHPEMQSSINSEQYYNDTYNDTY